MAWYNFTKGSSSYNQTYSFWDLFRGRGNRQSPQDQQGFIFTEQSGLTNSGERVNVDDLLDEATTASCINAIAQGITQIPVKVIEKKSEETFNVIEGHPITKLMNRPNDYQTSTEFKSSIVTAMLTHGNAFIKIVRAGEMNRLGNEPKPETIRGKPLQLYPLDPSDITIGSNALGKPVYSHEEYGQIRTENIIHIRDLVTFVPQGLSRALLAAEIIGAKKAADRLMANSFRGGLNLQYAVTTNGPADASKIENTMKQMQAMFGKNGKRVGGAAFIENGQITKLEGLKPADVDLRELRDMLIREIAAIFRVPPFMAGASGDNTYNNVRQYWTAFHRDTLQPIVTNIEEAITLKLLGENEYLHFDVKEILKGDIEVTSRVAQGNVSNGIWTPNEARKQLGTPLSDDPKADMLIAPNSSTNTNIGDGNERNPSDATGGSDGPQGSNNNG